ncbi:unnamed protein product [Ascophyllum nodosum]
MGEPVEVTVWFRTDGTFKESDALFIDLPRFTTSTLANGFRDGVDIPFGKARKLPSTVWKAAWREGVYNQLSPFETSRLTMTLKPGRSLGPALDEDLFLKISKRNGISVFCGWAEDWSGFQISSNSSEFDGVALETSPKVGNGCREDCFGQGVCDYCHETCLCYEGQGDKTADIVDGGGWVRLDCAHYVCPAGKSWAARQETLEGGGWAAIDDHALAECSGNGSCNRTEGSCICAPGFEGDACQRNACPSFCSGHGVCLNMRELGETAEALPLMEESNIYGGVGSNEMVAWDADTMHACVCDSSWEVGLGPGQRQQAEYFGADCSQQRCPTGDDPLTAQDETDCEGVEADGGFGIGQAGNLCHVDCSNRGQCNHATGDCACYAGFYGDNCNKTTALS